MSLQRPFLTSILAIGMATPFYAASPWEERFNQVDKDGNGVIEGAELETIPQLQSLDLDGDGKLTKDEAVRAFLQARRMREGKAEPGGNARGTGRVFRQLDRNRDGRLDRKELPDGRWFDKLDTDKDGAVTLEEAKKVIGETVPDVPPGSQVVREDASLKEQPLTLKPDEHGVGRRVPDLKFTSGSGEAKTLYALQGDKPLLLVLFSSECPLSNKFGPEIARLQADGAVQGYSFVLLNTVPGEKADVVSTFTKKHGLSGEIMNDPDQSALNALQATTTTEVFLLDAAHTLVYRGAINDQYGLGYSKEKPRQTYVRDAIRAVKDGQVPLVQATTAPGCELDLKAVAVSAPQEAVTYHREVSRIMQTHCVECHRKDGIAPFTLETFADVVDHAGMIRKQVERGVMPPWFAVGDKAHPTPWSNDRSMSEKDKADLLKWLASGRAEGNAADGPIPLKFSDAWTIGKPDTVLQIPKPVAVKAEGTMPYQRAIIQTSFAEDRWVSAYEIMPTAREVVHHVIVRMHPKGQPVTDRDEGADGFWAAYVPGNASRTYPDGFARKLPAGAVLSFQIHYTPNGKATEDQMKLGLKFAKEPPRYEMHVAAVAQPRFVIPAGEANHVVVKEQRAPFNMMITAYMAHMHVRGKAFKYEITYPDKTHEVLLDIPRYDFNWQLQYNYVTPKFIPQGSLVKITAVFDNSSNNPANPDPTKDVRWGAQTYDEMMIGYLEHYTPRSCDEVAGR